MTSKITRRRFLHLSAATATVLAVSGCTLNLQRTETLESYRHPPEDELPGENLWYAGACGQCDAGCGILVRTSNGRARKIEGLPDHPLNRGRLCARGQAALQDLYDPDRLRNAVQQSGGRNSRRFTPLSWDDALTQLNARLRTAPTGSIAFLAGHTATHLAELIARFQKALNGRPPLFYTQSDEWNGKAALLAAQKTFFDTPNLPYFDLERADVVFSFGADILGNGLASMNFSRAYKQFRQGPFGKRGALIQFEPRMSNTAAGADAWIPLYPGTGGLVAMALGRLIAERGAGRASLPAGFYDDVEINDIARVSGVPPATLKHMAALFISGAAPLAIPGADAVASRHGQEALRAIMHLNYFMGRLGQPGGLFTAPSPDRPGFISPTPASFTDLQTLVQDMAAGKVNILLIHGANPLFDLPPTLGFAEALRNVPLIVSFNSTVDETALQADLLLPDHTSLESWSYIVPALADRTIISAGQPAVRPLYDTRATADILLALAQIQGGELGTALPWKNEVEYLKDLTATWNEAGLDADQFWTEWRRRGGYWTDQPELKRPTPTPAINAPLKPNLLVVQDTGSKYPYHLQIYPAPALGSSQGANKPWLQELPDPMTTVSWQSWIEIHPATAKNLGLQDGDIVRVVSEIGEVEALVYLYPAIHPEIVAMPLGRGHTAFGRYAQSNGSNPIVLLPAQVDAANGALARDGIRVQLIPTGRRQDLARLDSPEGMEYRRSESGTESEQTTPPRPD